MKAVLLLCVLVFLNIPVTSSSCIFGSLCCGKKQETNALQILLGEGTEQINIDISGDCLLIPGYKDLSSWWGIRMNGEKYEVKENDDLLKFDDTIGALVIPKDSCRVGLDKSKSFINVISKNEVKPSTFKECPSNGGDELQFQAVFLRYVPNMNTFMFLDSSKARWFFTSELGGCDIFVATDPNKPDKPLVIHSNANSIENHKDNLEHKSDTVDMIMKFVPEGYQLKARVYHKSNSPDAQEYMTTYQITHPHIKEKNILAYDAESLDSHFYFFGHYYPDSQWRFFIRAIKGGKSYPVL